ncbi:probable Strong similarity to holacid-halidohydrolase [Zygosaccharomyces bailii ISA1307]|nr:probable Strong similarity to holacid-halidohydrolase [Zygosaccharomyces bailii ISA1307]
MDGLLINTEDIYTQTLSEILAKYGKGPLTWDVKIHLQGLPGPKAGEKVIKHYDLPLTVKQYEELNFEIQSQKWAECIFLSGAMDLIHYLKEQNIPIALCTSSSKVKYTQKTAHLNKSFQLFDVIVTGDDPRIPDGRGKPFPDIWQVGLQNLNAKFGSHISPSECLVFEDGLSGVKSGIAFGAYVIWVPHPEAHPFLGDKESVLDGHGEVLASLEDLDKARLGL